MLSKEITLKINNMIGFAIRSKAISFKQTLRFDFNKKRISLIIIANDISENTKKEFEDLFKSTSTIVYLNKSELGELFNKENVAIFGIKNENMAKKIKELYEKEVNYEEK